ncbi:hypothetical protein GLOIN_2v1779898 [Rhizophagus clarus]|uniref:Uncharacterized protein n=1 Tax=Rhizophagus clarus TaxID=94130 RepID=A0A8H3LCU3_9GLOM|nr:hypothetical protein GLOIN_2v1779898 [Rhizophagus clarus]
MQSTDSLRELNDKLLAEIAELRKKFAEIEGENGELKNENAKLRQIIEKNARRDAENAEHKVRIEELEKNSADISAENAELKAELAKLRYDFDSSNLTRPQQPQHVTNVQNSCSVGEEEISKVTTVPQPDAESESRFASDPVIDQLINGATSDNINIKSMEERETDAFLGEVYKKSVSNEIRERNREKKLLRESATQNLSDCFATISVAQDKKSQSHKKREVENIVQDVFDFTTTSAPEKEHMTEISMTGNPLPVTENTDEENSVVILSVAKSKPLLNLACLYQKACDAEKQRIRANQDEILCWYHYVIEFDNQVKNVMKTNRIGEKKAKGQIYDFIIAQLGTKRNTLLKQTQRARSIYKLFEKIGIDKIKYITTTELPDDQEGSIIDSEEEILDDHTNASEVVSAGVIPLKSVQSIRPKIKLPISILPEDPEEKRKHIIGLVLEKFPYLSLDDSDERRNLDGSTLCPFCNGDHKMNRSIFDEIKGEWGDGERKLRHVGGLDIMRNVLFS